MPFSLSPFSLPALYAWPLPSRRAAARQPHQLLSSARSLHKALDTAVRTAAIGKYCGWLGLGDNCSGEWAKGAEGKHPSILMKCDIILRHTISSLVSKELGSASLHSVPAVLHPYHLVQDFLH